MTRVTDRNGIVFDVAEDQVGFWTERGYRLVDAKPKAQAKKLASSKANKK